MKITSNHVLGLKGNDFEKTDCHGFSLDEDDKESFLYPLERQLAKVKATLEKAQQKEQTGN